MKPLNKHKTNGLFLQEGKRNQVPALKNGKRDKFLDKHPLNSHKIKLLNGFKTCYKGGT